MSLINLEIFWGSVHAAQVPKYLLPCIVQSIYWLLPTFVVVYGEKKYKWQNANTGNTTRFQKERQHVIFKESVPEWVGPVASE
jgi:hypothetical protein